jgi:hypothetical protein
VGGGIPLTPRPCGGYGKLIKSLLGKEQIKQGYQECGMTGLTGATDTGLSASNTYYFKMNVDGSGEQEYNISTGAGPTITYSDLLTLLAACMAANTVNAEWNLWAGDLRATSMSNSSPSTIALASGTTGTDLFSSLTGFTAFDSAVDGAPMQTAGCIRIRYKGSDASCRLQTNGADNTLASSSGAKGSETPDSNFGSGGIIDFDLGSYDTLGEVVTEIDGYTDYDCEKLFGIDSLDLTSNTVEHSVIVQGSRIWAYIFFESAASGVYKHTFLYNISTEELPTYSIQKDGYQDNFLYTGCVVNTLSLSAALKGMAEGDVDILGFTEAGSQTASELALEDVDPMIFHKGSMSLGSREYTYVRNISVEFNNNHNAEGYGQGSTSRQYHQKGLFEGSGEVQVRLDADSYAERAKVFSNDLISLSFYFKGKNILTDIPELCLVELPYCNIQEFGFTENAGVFDASISYKVLYPKGIIYNNPVRITLLTLDSEIY